MTDKILITGATGTLGRALVRQLQQAGADLRLLSRSEHRPDDNVEWVRGDVSTGSGLDAAVRGVHTVVHCAGSQRDDGDKARNLLAAAVDAGVEHIIHVSVVGADTVPVVSAVDRAMFGYFASKRAAEDVITHSPIPWTMLRPTQFHDFVTTIMDQLVRLPVLPLWRGVRFQPVDTDDVARRLAELVRGEPAGIVPALGGPRVYSMEQLARDYLRAVGKRRAIANLPIPGRAAAAFRAGANLAADHADGTTSWEDFLAAKFPDRAFVTAPK
ncbi:SDR family oxidoreductase [Microlunatus sp. Gsoil 973]|uniref:SDR family oxidoreductase n=1 Tax=Microlunatus sp. Gsoil 973 TaxID=2672569 RepID=UPI0012B49629|nr:NAD(P)H-binding protein [Microlunatus sp. Gsoil 973]QGN32663.1 NAD(P)H-binding protein [Microlunatus sp. Gsoil 973]